MTKRQINCWIPEEAFEKIEERAKRMGMKISSYGSLILDEWAAKDEPLTPIEKELAKLKKSKRG
ncbi:MAG: hypothetical protein ACPG3X_06505 [Opitutales bacterium]